MLKVYKTVTIQEQMGVRVRTGGKLIGKMEVEMPEPRELYNEK